MDRDQFIASLVAAGFSRADAVEEWEQYAEGLALDLSAPPSLHESDEQPEESK